MSIMHPVGEKRGHSKYTAEALESIKQDLTRFEVHNSHQDERHPVKKYDKCKSRNDAIECLSVKPQVETSQSAHTLQIVEPPSNRQSLNGNVPKMLSVLMPTKINRDSNTARESLPYLRCSPAIDSGAGSSRSNSPPSHHQINCINRSNSGRTSPSSSLSDIIPPAPPPRNVGNGSTPPPPPPINHAFKRRSPALPRTSVISGNPSRSTSMGMSQNSYVMQQQTAHQIKPLNVYHVSSNNGEPPPPPYPINATSVSPAVPPPSYTASIQSCQSPAQSPSEYRKSPSSGIYSSTSGGSGSPITVTNSSSSPLPQPVSSSRLQPRSYHGRTQHPIIMQSVKSTQVQKPVLQTAVAPQTPHTSPYLGLSLAVSTAASVYPTKMTIDPKVTSALCSEPPSYAKSIQAKTTTRQDKQPQKEQFYQQNQLKQYSEQNSNSHVVEKSQHHQANLNMQEESAKLKQAFGCSNLSRQKAPPPPYYSGRSRTYGKNLLREVSNNKMPSTNFINHNVAHKSNKLLDKTVSNTFNENTSDGEDTQALPSNSNKSGGNLQKIKHASPIPERKKVSKEQEQERKEFRIRQYSSQAFKFFMEQHIENVIKSHKQRTFRKNQLEKEMLKIGLSVQTQVEMRKMLSQKESNYIRLKRAKMDKSMFVKIKPIGLGAFGEVTLVRKIDTTNHLYAMKTLRKADVLKRNQVAHVKAERDILAEADNNWVVKLYYSFQDNDNLYFVMDYIPGGDLMSLLIKKGIFEEPLAQFYIAELTSAVESVHKMGFIHRDIKPDNILIDRDGHIKLTDFGLCTGFRWTHNSKYYQENCNHARQDSMEPWEDFSENGAKPTVLERRRIRDHQRVLAHSLVGTPNYIAPEVLERSGYTQLCDWWSVGVILYEMLVGQPPFLANTPQETQQKVINWEKSLHIPRQAKLSSQATDLIKRLCSSSENRLGKSADEVKSHDFFSGIDFADMRKQRAPYIPKIEHPTDTSNFDPIDPEKLRSADSNLSNNEEVDKPFHGFFEFTFRRFFDDRLNADVSDEQLPVYV